LRSSSSITREMLGAAAPGLGRKAAKQAEDAWRATTQAATRGRRQPVAFVADKPETAAGRRALEELKGDIVDGAT
jgi:putative membrane protein